MSLKAKYCSQCGADIKTGFVHDEQREICSACGTVFYQNPLPVAASVILNKKREVLLVKRKRQPQKGMWCLPIGFAEIGETIYEAALRELKEETGIEGQVLRLLDVNSFKSDFYGDLLVVTFEVDKTGGTERGGDDADEVSYFPLQGLPPLAFSVNEDALQICMEAHYEEWAIQDSFRKLEDNEGSEMLSDALVALVKDHAEEISRVWLSDVRSNPTTASYRKIDPEQLFNRAKHALLDFGRWLRGDDADHEIRAFYRVLGQERKSQGFAVYEVLSSLTLLKKHLWTFAGQLDVWEKPIDVYRMLELNRRFAVFFDKASYYTAIGFGADQPSNDDHA